MLPCNAVKFAVPVINQPEGKSILPVVAPAVRLILPLLPVWIKV